MKIPMQDLSRPLLILAIALGFSHAHAQTGAASKEDADRAAWARWIKTDFTPPARTAKTPEPMLPASAPEATIEELKPPAPAPAAVIPQRASAAPATAIPVRASAAPAAAIPVRGPYVSPVPPGAPGLAPDRRINEQDCTKAVDLFAGNLRCK